MTAHFVLRPANELLKRRAEKNIAGAGPAGLTLAQAGLIGLAQAVAVIPGISRSGATIAAGLHSWLSRDYAARFSFLMSIPIVLGAVAHKLPEMWVPFLYDEHKGILIAGVVAAAVTGFLAVRFMLRLLVTGDLHRFIVYLWVIGLLCVAS